MYTKSVGVNVFSPFVRLGSRRCYPAPMPSLREKLAREVRYAATFARVVPRILAARPEAKLTIPDVIERWVGRTPDAEAMVHGARSFTYRQLDAYANKVARWALAQGARRGDVVALMMPNRLEYVGVWLGVLKMGGVCALINSHLRGQPLAHSIRTSGAALLVLDHSLTEQWSSAVLSLTAPPEVWVHHPEGESGAADAPARSLDAALEAIGGEPLPATIRRGQRCEESAIFIYTSGTTGMPKAAKITHVRGLTMMHGFAAAMGARSTDRIYVPLPLYHGTGGVGAVGAALTEGGCIVIRDRFSASHFWSDIVEHRCTMFTYVGELCRYLVNSAPHPDERRHKIRCCMGNGLRPEVWERFRDRFALPHIVEFYGSSEGNVAMFNLDDKVGSVGRLPPYMRPVFQFRVVEYDVQRGEIVRDRRGRVRECAPGEVGELIGLIDANKPGGRFDGYADQKATEKKILRGAFKDGDRWFCTGDLLRKDAEGYFYFVDRVGDTFRWKGENVATSEVAEVLATFPEIAEANVYGVSVAGADGRAGMAAIVADSELDLDALYQHVRRDLASYARPLFLRRSAAMRVTGTLKHQKADLVREGFDPARVDDPLYLRDDKRQTYVPLTAELHASILSGALRL